MALNRNQIQEIQKKPVSKILIQRAKKNQQQIRFHVETNMDRTAVSDAAGEFLLWVKNILPADKFHIFNHLFTYPIPTNELTQEVFTALEKVYDARDAYEEYNFVSPTWLDDWNNYRAQVLNSDEFWKNIAFEKFKTSINGILAVDMPAQQATERPEPYFFFLEIDQLYDYDNLPTGSLEWIMFNQPNNKRAVYCDGFYRLYELDIDGNMPIDPIIEVAHDLGYCPAIFFWETPLQTKIPTIKKHILANQLSSLNWLLFFKTSKKHLDLYASYPIYSGYEQDCDFTNKDNGDYCDGGLLRNKDSIYILDHTGHTSKCPVCGDKRLAGAGSFVEVPAPNRGNDYSDMRNPVQITTIDKDSLDYNVNETERLKMEIFTSVVGAGGDIKLNKAFNLEQIQATFEGRKNVLLNIARNMQKAKEFVDNTICKLRYGNYFLGSTTSFGTEYYVFGLMELQEQYKTAKESGATDYELDVIQEQIIETENKNNPMQLARANVLRQLEPYRHQTRTEVVEIWEKGLADDDLVIVKLNFSNFVARFERENTDIVNFGKNISFDVKINTILKKLIDYGNEQKRTGQKVGSETGNEKGTGAE